MEISRLHFYFVAQKELTSIVLDRALPTEVDDAKIENQSQNANYRCDDHIADNQADEKRD